MGLTIGLGSRYTNRKFLPFQEAREYVRKLGLKTEKEWREYCRSGNLPSYIPTNPAKKYKKDWINIGDWLGTGNIGNRARKFLPFQEAREYVR